MKSASPVFSHLLPFRIFHLFPVLSFFLAAGAISGCGSGGTLPLPPATGQVTVLVSSTANDKLSQFNLGFTGITLTSQSGSTVNLLTGSQSAEFIHLNGSAEPLVTTSVPQDVYTAATATIGPAQFTCVNLNSSGGLEVSTFAYGATPSGQITVSVPTPITITSTTIGLSLDLVVSKSATYATCDPTGVPSYSINPTFNLTPVTIASQPTNNGNGKETGLKGIVASIDTGKNTFTVTAADGPSWSVTSNGSTVYQGIGGLSGLATGMAVDMDAAIQSDGSLLATRVTAEDTNTANLSLSTGPLEFVASSVPVVNAFGREEQGYLYATTKGSSSQPFSFDKAVFQTSGQLTNLGSLPFSASFNAANMVAGQNVSISSHALTRSSGPIYIPAATLTLMPQTINGTVSAISSAGNFTTYTVALAAYDLMPALSVQAGQTTLLQNPTSVVVYADSGTQTLNTVPIAVGSVLRFHGLLFNDGGTLRMDCAWVNNGVAE